MKLNRLIYCRTSQNFYWVKDLTHQVSQICCCSCLVAPSCLTLGGPMDCGPSDPSVHEILQARILEWDLPDPGIEPRCPELASGFSTTEPPGKPLSNLLDPRTVFMKCQAKIITAQNILRAGVPKLRDLIPNDLRQSWSNNNRNKVHDKCNGLESSWNHPPQPSVCGKNCLPWNPSLVPKRLGTAD